MPDDDSYIRLYLAEYASVFADGSVTMVRGFLSHWKTNTIPRLLQVHLVVDVRSPSAVSRERDFTFEIRSPAGLSIASVGGRFGRSAEHDAQYALPLSFQVVEYGKHTLELHCEDAVGTMSLDVRRLQVPEST